MLGSFLKQTLKPQKAKYCDRRSVFDIAFDP